MERRSYKQGSRSGAQGQIIAGYAAVFDCPSEDLGGFREIIKPGAFSEVLESNPDVRALFNHDPDRVLGRTSSGTLKLRQDSVGLYYEITPPDTRAGRDVALNLARGTLNQSSFSFRVGEDTWTTGQDGLPVRVVHTVSRLYDVSPVIFPAYSQTSAGLRTIKPGAKHWTIAQARRELALAEAESKTGRQWTVAQARRELALAELAA